MGFQVGSSRGFALNCVFICICVSRVPKTTSRFARRTHRIQQILILRVTGYEVESAKGKGVSVCPFKK